MILKQRLRDGFTQFIDIGGNFTISTPANNEWNPNESKDVHGIVSYCDNNGKLQHEPLYIDFPQWLYSNDGQLFITLTSNDYGKKTEQLGVIPPEINIGQVVNFLLNGKTHSATVRDFHIIENKVRYDLDVWLEFDGGNTSTRINDVDSDFITPA